MDVKVHLYVNKDEIKKYLFSLRNSFENGYEHLPYVLSENDKIYLCLIPLNLSDLLLNSSTVVNNAIDNATKHVAIHKITGLVS